MTMTATLTATPVVRAPSLFAQLTTKSLKEGLARVEKFIRTRSSSPVLTYARFDFTPDGLTISGTNLDVDAQTTIRAQSSSSGSVLVPFHFFSQAIKGGKSALVELSLEGQMLTVRMGGSVKTFDCTAELENFPPLDFTPRGEFLDFAAPTLIGAVKSVLHAPANEAFQAVFRGIKLEVSHKHTRFVASDGFRLAVHTLPAQPGALREGQKQGDSRGSIFEPNTLDPIIKAIGNKCADTIRVYPYLGGDFGGAALLEVGSHTRFKVKLMDGEFPDHERAIPKEIKLRVVINAKRLVDAVNDMAAMADKTANNRVQLIIKNSSITLSAEGDYGKAEQTLECLQEGTEPQMTLGFNAKYMTDALKQIEGDAVLEFSGSNTPSKFSPLSGSGFMGIVVPLHS